MSTAICTLLSFLRIAPTVPCAGAALWIGTHGSPRLWSRAFASAFGQTQEHTRIVHHRLEDSRVEPASLYRLTAHLDERSRGIIRPEASVRTIQR